MPPRRTRGRVSSPHGITALVALVLAITAGAALAGSSRSPREPERIFVTAVSGSVSVTMAGSSTPVQIDSTVGLPARIVTGDDGMLSLTQAGTNITIAADSDVEIPAEAADGQLIARLVQRRGNVFYDVAHREAGTLRVETPFLVAVIKGTQFNVAVQDGGSAISLFQGRLEIDAPDGSDSVFINAGQIATRSNIDKAISVIGMNDVRLEAPRTGDTVARNDALQPRVFATPDGARDTPASAVQARLESARSDTDVGGPASGIGADVDLGSVASVGRSLRVGTGSPGVGAGGMPAALGVSAGLGAGGASASLGVSADLGAGGAPVSLGVSAGLGAGGASASVGANVSVGTGSPGLSLGAAAGPSAGGVPASLGLNAGLGAGGAPASLGANLNVSTGNPGLSLGAGAGSSVGGTPASVGANLNVGAGGPGVSVGTDLGVGVSVNLGPTGVGGSVTIDTGHGNNGLHLGTGGNIGDNPGLHLGIGGGIGDNPGLHLGNNNGNGNLAPPGKSHGHP